MFDKSDERSSDYLLKININNLLQGIFILSIVRISNLNAQLLYRQPIVIIWLRLALKNKLYASFQIPQII